MAEYTPSEDDVREGYALAPFEAELPDYGDEFLGQTADDRRAAWSRWLAAHDARVRRDAALEALGGLYEDASQDYRIGLQGDDRERMDAAEAVLRATYAWMDNYPETEDQK